MFGFLIKKTFFDMWDNLFRIVLLNLGFLAVFAILVYIPFLFRSVPALLYLSMILGLAILFVYTGLASRMVREIADYRSAELRELVRYLRDSWPSSLLFFAVNAVFFFLLSIAFPVYGRMQSLVGPIAASLLFWITLIWILSCLFFYPVQSRLDRNIRKILRKMLLLFLDNPLFSIGLLLGGLFIFAISLFTAFLLPGPATLLLWLNAGLKLRLYKYDYLEQNPQADRRRIPWDALLVEDRERVGKRTLKGMIFPWKE
jgi:uncharacterized membrane protein